MNEALYKAVFCYGEQKVDPFENCKVDFERIISDMKLVGYELNTFNIVQQIMLEQLDVLLKYKNQIIELAMDLENKDDFCREKYGVSFKDIVALDPQHDMEWDIKSGRVIFYLNHEGMHKEEQYAILFKKALEQFVEKTGFEYTSMA